MSGKFYFQPQSGWCWWDQGDEITAENPPSGTSFTIFNGTTGVVRQALEGSRTDSSLLESFESFNLPGLSHMVKNLTRHPVRNDPSLESVLGLEDPHRLWVEVQGNCNERCQHCYASSGPFDLPSLSRETVTEVVRDAVAIGFDRIQFTGGDPLLWESLPELVNFTRDKGIDPEIYTNGLALSAGLFDELKPANPHFSFSFYSHDSASHDRITGVEGSWEQTLEAILRVKESGLSLRVAVVEMGENGGQLPETVQFLRDRGIDSEEITTAPVRSVGRGADQTVPPQDPSPSDEDRLDPEDSNGFTQKGKVCVAYTGEVLPCIFQRDLSLGSVQEDSLQRIVSDPSLTMTNESSGEESGSVQYSCADCRFNNVVLNELAEKQ